MANLNFLSTLLASEKLTMPSGFWEGIIGWFYNFIGDYGFTILIISVLIKLLMLPIEFFQRKSSIKSARIQQKIAPQMQKIQEKYGHDRNMLNQKQMELYRKENYSVFGSCGIMLLYLLVSLVVFITLFNAMNNITNTSIKQQYSELRTAYYSVAVVDENNLTEFEKAEREEAVLKRYNEIKVDWLWVENLWRSDTATSPIASFKDYKKVAKISKADMEQAKAEYNAIMNPLRKDVRSVNGYYLLIILAATTTLLSSLIGQWTQKQKKQQQKAEVDRGRILNAEGKTEKQDPYAGTNKASKIMMFVLPIIMVIITLSYSAAFAIYIVSISLVSMISTFIFNKIIGKMDLDAPDKKAEEKRQLSNRPEYSRPEYSR